MNRGGATFRDVIVDAGAPAGSLLYRVSYGMTGGYARSPEDARADDDAIAAAEEAAREAAKAPAAAGGRWGARAPAADRGSRLAGLTPRRTRRSTESRRFLTPLTSCPAYVRREDAKRTYDSLQSTYFNTYPRNESHDTTYLLNADAFTPTW